MRCHNERASSRVCLFAHHDRRGGVTPAVLHYLRELRRAGYQVHLARSDDRKLASADRDALVGTGATLLLRPNRGLDFGAWQALITAGATAGATEILLANDSVIGPFTPLAPIRRAMQGFDVWGMVSSREGRRHLQSWFVCLSADAFDRAPVRRVLALPFDEMSKAEIIVHGELGLSAAFEAASLDVGARYVDEARLRPSALLPTNPTHFRWRSLLRDGAVPFIKTELVRDNPVDIVGVGRWRTVLAELGYPDPTSGATVAGTASTPGRPRTDRWRDRAFHLALHERRFEALRDAWRTRPVTRGRPPNGNGRA